MSSGGNNFNYFSENQLAKFIQFLNHSTLPLPLKELTDLHELGLHKWPLAFPERATDQFAPYRRTRLSTVGDRLFPVAAARVWNSLPHHVTSAPSLTVFQVA